MVSCWKRPEPSGSAIPMNGRTWSVTMHRLVVCAKVTSTWQDLWPLSSTFPKASHYLLLPIIYPDAMCSQEKLMQIHPTINIKLFGNWSYSSSSNGTNLCSPNTTMSLDHPLHCHSYFTVTFLDQFRILTTADWGHHTRPPASKILWPSYLVFTPASNTNCLLAT